jgi:hypothetical protein
VFVFVCVCVCVCVCVELDVLKCKHKKYYVGIHVLTLNCGLSVIRVNYREFHANPFQIFKFQVKQSVHPVFNALASYPIDSNRLPQHASPPAIEFVKIQ